jgi:hypothetical protein
VRTKIRLKEWLKSVFIFILSPSSFPRYFVLFVLRIYFFHLLHSIIVTSTYFCLLLFYIPLFFITSPSSISTTFFLPACVPSTFFNFLSFYLVHSTSLSLSFPCSVRCSCLFPSPRYFRALSLACWPISVHPCPLIERTLLYFPFNCFHGISPDLKTSGGVASIASF